MIRTFSPRIASRLPRLFPAGAAFLAMAAAAPRACGDVPAVVFVSRSLAAEPDAAQRSTAIERAGSGRLLVREASGVVRVLADRSLQGGVVPADVMDPEVSYDGSRIVFAGFSPEEGAWRIFEVAADGSALKQLTRSDRQVDLSRYGAAARLLEGYDDVDPFYLPDGRIGFVSTRYPAVAPDGRLRATNLYVMEANGSGMHRITTERFGADTPAVDPTTGKIVYSRWWRTAQAVVDPSGKPPEPIPPGSPGYGAVVIDESDQVLRGVEEKAFPGVNSWFLSSIDPDGTDLAMFSGFRLDRGQTQAYRPSFLSSGEALALFIPETPFLGYPRGNGLRLYRRGPSLPTALGGPQSFGIFPGVDAAPLLPFLFFVYASAVALDDGRVLVTGAKVLGPTLDYGIFIQTRTEVDQPLPLLNDAGTAELDAVVLAARPLPPTIRDADLRPLVEEAPRNLEEALARGGSFTFRCENIFFNAPVDVAIPHAPPVGQRLDIEFYMSPQRTDVGSADPPILIRKLEVPVDGRIETELPGGVPLFELLRRPDGALPLGRDGQIFHVGGMNFGRAGETNRCVGCHAGHSQIAVPADASWTNLAPSAMVRASSSRSFAIDAAVDGQALPFPGMFDMFGELNLVDRQTGGPGEEWAGQAEPESVVELDWTTRLRAREVVVHGVAPGTGSFGERSLAIRAFQVRLLRDRVELQRLSLAQAVVPEGTRVALDPSIEFDSLAIVIKAADMTGLHEGERGAALAEVEVIAQAAGDPFIMFRRGDTDCNASVELTDAIVILGHLFLGTGRICCQAAADVNEDRLVDISDPIALLRFMFLGDQAPPAPFPECGRVTDPGMVCEVGSCR